MSDTIRTSLRMIVFGAAFGAALGAGLWLLLGVFGLLIRWFPWGGPG